MSLVSWEPDLREDQIMPGLASIIKMHTLFRSNLSISPQVYWAFVEMSAIYWKAIFSCLWCIVMLILGEIIRANRDTFIIQ